MNLGVLLVGLGRIGMGYDLPLAGGDRVCSHARAFTLHPAFRLVGGVDPDSKNRRIFEQTYAGPSFASLAAALGDCQPDVIVIAGPTEAHGVILREALGSSQLRAVLCEKPISYDLAEARAMVRECEEQNVRLFVNYMRRSDPAAIEIKRRLDLGEIQTPVKGVAWYSKGFLHNGSHFFNLLEYWLGSMEGAAVLDAGRLWDNRDPEPDVRVVFSRGTVVFLAAREEAFSHYTVELVAPNGRLRYDRGGEEVSWQSAGADPDFQDYFVLSGAPEMIASGMDRYQWNVADQMALALAGRGHSLCSGQEALATLEGMHTIIQPR
jgi:predicted dehydrogenase